MSAQPPASGPAFVGDQSSGGRKGGVKSSTGVDPSGAMEAVMSGAGQRDGGGVGTPRRPAQAGPSQASPAPTPAGPSRSPFAQPGRGHSQPSVFEILAEQANPRDPDLLVRALATKYRHPDMIRLLDSVDNA